MPKPPPPDHAREAKMTLRKHARWAANARRDWTEVRAEHSAAFTVNAQADAQVGHVTRVMWSAEANLRGSVIKWREVLDERAALPVADRWDLAALERWAVAQDKAGAP